MGMQSLRCHPGGFVKEAVVYISLEFRREVGNGDKNGKCQLIDDIKLWE